MKYLLRTLPANFFQSLWGKNLLWNLVAIITTYIIVKSGLDWWYFVFLRNRAINAYLFPAVIIGGILPILVPLGFIIAGNIKKNRRTTIIGWALGQAAILGWFISSLYKAFTGRIQPNLYDTVTDISRMFNFGFFKHGIFWGWPSSHTTVAFAIALACITLFPKNKSLKVISLIYALYIGIGVSLSIHWFSEFIAGAIIGSVIGAVVGKNFRKIL